MNGPPHLLARRRFWILPVLLVVLSTAVLSGAVILLVVKHVGLLGPVSALSRWRRSRNGP